MSGSIGTYVLSCERYEMLRCCLAGICGYNAGTQVTVIDDHSTDPRIRELLGAYKASSLIADYVSGPIRVGVQGTRRRALNTFLDSGQGYLVQVEEDMLLPPAAIGTLIEAYDALKASWLGPHYHNNLFSKTIPIQNHKYTYAIVERSSEPFWVMSREAVSKHLCGLIPGHPDLMGVWRHIRESGENVMTLIEPEIQAQHIGSIGKSFYYPNFGPEVVQWTRANGSPRQPYPFLHVDWKDLAATYPQCYLDWAYELEVRSPIPLPRLP